MGKRNRAAVMTYWAPVLRQTRGSRALLAAFCIADKVPDGRDEWYGGNVHLAELMGLHAPGDEFDATTRQAVKRAVRQLREAGFLEPTSPAMRGSNAVYRVHWKEPSVWPTGGL